MLILKQEDYNKKMCIRDSSMGVDYLTVICAFGYFGLPEMGTKGAAIATVVGQIIAMLLGCLLYTSRCV